MSTRMDETKHSVGSAVVVHRGKDIDGIINNSEVGSPVTTIVVPLVSLSLFPVPALDVLQIAKKRTTNLRLIELKA